MNELKRRMRGMIMDTRLRALENRISGNRTSGPWLKSPLTSAQALVGVVRMTRDKREWTRSRDI